MKRAVWAALVAVAAVLYLNAPAHADIGGHVPGPGGCDYPMVGTEGMEGAVVVAVYDAACSGPTEVNGSHWQSFYGGAASEASIGGGISISFLHVEMSVSAPTGVLRGIQYWACPDLSVADQPNPVGAWNQRITPTKCKTVKPKPAFLDPPADPDAPADPPAPNAPVAPPGANTPNFPKAM